MVVILTIKLVVRARVFSHTRVVSQAPVRQRPSSGARRQPILVAPKTVRPDSQGLPALACAALAQAAPGIAARGPLIPTAAGQAGQYQVGLEPGLLRLKRRL